MTVRICLAWFVLLLAFFLPGAPAVASENPSYDNAMAQCQAYMGSVDYRNNFVTGGSSMYYSGMRCEVGPSDIGGCTSQTICMKYTDSRNPSFRASTGAYGFTGSVPPSAACAAGTIVPPGTNYSQSSVTGEACTSGANQCEMSFVLGGPNSGAQMLTGNACPALGTPKSGVVPPKSSETVNADGSKTFCDPISGKCVTSSSGPATAPASSSSSANNSTDTTSTTHNPASSSSSTTTSTSTTTTTGDGSGTGSGNSTGVTTGTSTTKTDTPASASSTAAKCTGGACDVGNADGNMGQLYQAGTDTPASVYSDFKAQVSSSPIMSAATGFFDASSLSGSTCPTWQIPGNKYWGQAGFSFDFFCSSGMLALLALAGYIVLAVGAFSAFRIAIY